MADTNILIADDHPIIINATIGIIKEMFSANTLFHAANSFDKIIEIIETSYIDLLILDINMPDVRSHSVIAKIKLLQPDLKILVFSSYDEDLYALRYIQAGCNGYLQKDCSEEELRVAVRSVIEKGKYASKNLVENILFNRITKDGKLPENPFEQLSKRELEVAQLIIDGYGVLEISNALSIKISTVSTYKNRVFEKLGVNNIPELYQLYLNHKQMV